MTPLGPRGGDSATTSEIGIKKKTESTTYMKADNLWDEKLSFRAQEKKRLKRSKFRNTSLRFEKKAEVLWVGGEKRFLTTSLGSSSKKKDPRLEEKSRKGSSSTLFGGQGRGGKMSIEHVSSEAKGMKGGGVGEVKKGKKTC